MLKMKGTMEYAVNVIIKLNKFHFPKGDWNALVMNFKQFVPFLSIHSPDNLQWFGYTLYKPKNNDANLFKHISSFQMMQPIKKKSNFNCTETRLIQSSTFSWFIPISKTFQFGNDRLSLCVSYVNLRCRTCRNQMAKISTALAAALDAIIARILLSVVWHAKCDFDWWKKYIFPGKCETDDVVGECLLN